MAVGSMTERQRVGELGAHVARRAHPLSRRRAEVAGDRAIAHAVEARVAADGQRAPPHHLEAVVAGRVVRGGDREPALVAVLADGEVHHLGAGEPDVVDVAPRVERAADRGLGELLRGQAHVVADRDARRLELVDVRARDAIRPVGVELVGDDAADVVGLEDSRVKCHAGIVRPETRARAPAAPCMMPPDVDHRSLAAARGPLDHRSRVADRRLVRRLRARRGRRSVADLRHVGVRLRGRGAVPRDRADLGRQRAGGRGARDARPERAARRLRALALSRDDRRPASARRSRRTS